MKEELNPLLFWGVIVILAVGVIGFIVFRTKGGSGEMKTTGSESEINRVQGGGQFYTPPANAPVPGNR